MTAYLVRGGRLYPLEDCPEQWRRLPRLDYKRWVQDLPRRPECSSPTSLRRSTKGRKFPATPIYGDDARRILDAMYHPDVHATGKWATKWGPIRHRNRTVMEVAKGTGARIHELLLLRRSDIDFDTHQVVIRRGKGGKRRIVAICPTRSTPLAAGFRCGSRPGSVARTSCSRCGKATPRAACSARRTCASSCTRRSAMPGSASAQFHISGGMASRSTRTAARSNWATSNANSATRHRRRPGSTSRASARLTSSTHRERGACGRGPCARPDGHAGRCDY